jgi:hypothetical protein
VFASRGRSWSVESRLFAEDVIEIFVRDEGI